MFELVMPMFPGCKALEKKKNGESWNPVVNHGLESLDEKDRDDRKAGYLAKKADAVMHGGL